jgi:hypothetical protein
VKLKTFHALACGHLTPAPAPARDNGDAEICPAWIECPVCGMPKRWQGYVPGPPDGFQLGDALIEVPR